MASGAQRRIDRAAIESLSGLELRARSAVEGYYSGIHKSPYHGFNVEFDEYREYSPGDDPRFIDWRVFGRSDRFFVKQFEAETNLNCYILLDVSGSMDFSTQAPSRLDYGCGLAAAIALLMLRQGDHVGLVTFDEKVRHFVPPRGHARHFTVLRESLEHVRAGNDTNLAAVMHEIAERIRRRSLVVLISDFFDKVETVMSGLQHFRHRRHEVIALHLLDDAEINFPFDRVTLFEGLERDKSVVADPHVIGDGYRARFAAYLEEFRHGCTEKGIDYQRMLLSQPYERALTAYLGRRR